MDSLRRTSTLFVSADIHAAQGEERAEYVFKLLLAHDITTINDVGSSMGLGWNVQHKRRSENNDITAPRIIADSIFPGASHVNASITGP
ncbi:MAG: hypothetical protein ACI9FB_002170 [Candidatus Azotimanducaceae bacterium]|jgi:hypothetical protein